MVDENNNSCFKRSSTVKWLRACSAVRLLVLDNSPVLLGDTEKNLEKPLPPPPHRKLRPFEPPSSPLNFRCLPCVCVWGVWIFSGTTQFNPLYTDTFCGPLSIHINAVWPHSSQIVSLKHINYHTLKTPLLESQTTRVPSSPEETPTPPPGDTSIHRTWKNEIQVTCICAASQLLVTGSKPKYKGRLGQSLRMIYARLPGPLTKFV